MARRLTAKQAEIEGTESPARNPELHALGLEIKAFENERKDITKKEKGKRQEAIGIMHSLNITSYHVDGVQHELEGKEKLKVSLDSDSGGEE
jgi:hypothetical protein